MIYKELFEKVLIEPALELPGGRLRILSGYATANMADMHMEKLDEELHQQSDISIELVVGMTARSGIQEAQHLAFQKIAQAQTWSTDLQCSYVTSENPPVHAKAYVVAR